MTSVGSDLTSFFKGTQSDALIVAPFIRTKALNVLLEQIPADVRTTVVTRWRIKDLLSKVSDLGVYDSLKSIGANLLLRYDLHAKLFASDEQCLVGSANVTDTALGWRLPQNLELLVPIPRSDPRIVQFEKILFLGAVPATLALRDCLASYLQINSEAQTNTQHGQESELFGNLPFDWVPCVRNPEDLFVAYQGSSDFGRVELETMQMEIARLGVMPGLDEDEFYEWIAVASSQSPVIQTVLHEIEQKGEMTEADMGIFLRRLGIHKSVGEAKNILENLQRWMTCFFATQYETVSDSIKLIRARTVMQDR